MFLRCFVEAQRVTWNVVYYNYIDKEMFHLHSVLFKKSEFAIMSLIGSPWLCLDIGALRESKIRGKFNLKISRSVKTP